MLLPTALALAEARPTAEVARHQEGQEAARPEVRPTAAARRQEGPEGVHLAAARHRARPTQAVAAAGRPAAPQSPEAVRLAAAHRSLADQAGAAARPTAVAEAAARRQRSRRRALQPLRL